MRTKKRQRSAAFLLVICMVASLFTGIPANAEENTEGLVAKDWIDWTEDGVPYLNENAEFTKESWPDLIGYTMYLAYLEAGEEKKVTKEDISITLNGEEAGDAVSCEPNEQNGDFLDFLFQETGDYTITYKGSGTADKSITLHVGYPEVGFYTSAEKSADTLIRDYNFDYKQDGNNTFYMILHRCEYAKLDLENIVYRINGEEAADISEYVTITAPADLPSLDSPEDCLEAADYVYEISINKQESFGFEAEVQKTDVYENEEGENVFAEEAYLLGRGVDINYIEKKEGLVAKDWIDWDGDVPSVNPEAEFAKEISADLNGMIMYLGYVENEGEDPAVVSAEDISVQYEGIAATKEQVTYSAHPENNELIEFCFYAVGDYTLMYQDSSITVHVDYPKIGFYETDEMTEEGFIREMTYERKKGKTFYIIPNKQDDWADFSYQIMTENTYDDEVYVKVNGKALNASEAIRGTAEVTITEDAKLGFDLKAVGTFTYLDGNPGDWNPEQSYWCEDTCEGEPTGIKITAAPNKTSYKEGEKFDKTGMVVELVYSDGSTQKITSYTVPTAALTKADTEIEVAYKDFSAKQVVTVKAPTGIKITTAPNKTSYKEGEKFDKTGMVVELVYSDESTEKITDYTVPTAALKETDKEITVTYGEYTVKQAITVKAPTGIKITAAPKKTAYTAGEKFDKTGMVVEVVYSDGSTEKITDYTVPTAALKETDKEITVTYGKFTVKQTITVKAAPKVPDTTETENPAKTGDTATVNGSSYKITSVADNKKTVTYTGSDKKAAKVTVPSTVTIDGTAYKVTAIADSAFSGSSKLTTVSISPNVTSIGKKAFSGCKKLSKVTIGKDVKTIGVNAFSGCGKLKTVNMGANVTTIGDKAFYKCTALTKITIPAKVSKIGKQAFYGCKKLKTITIKTTKLTSKKVGSKAFKGIHAKATIKVPKKKLTSYKKILKAKGVGSKVKIKK